MKPRILGVEPRRQKARLVPKGYAQRESVNYQEVFSPVVKHISIWIMVLLVVHADLEFQQMGVK